MNRLGLVGGLFSVVGLLGYGIGVFEPYPGRSVSIALFMLGVTLLGISSLDVQEEPQ